MENYIERIKERGYVVVSKEEDESIVAFVNEDVKYCCILISSYKGLDDSNEKLIEKLFEHTEILNKSYNFANKGTILLIADMYVSIEERFNIESDVYNYIKTYVDSIDILPIRIDKTIDITFSCMDSSIGMDMLSDSVYIVDPYKEFDGISVQSYLKFLNGVTEDCIVYYPKIYEPYYIRYVANKFFNVK